MSLDVLERPSLALHVFVLIMRQMMRFLNMNLTKEINCKHWRHPLLQECTIGSLCVVNI